MSLGSALESLLFQQHSAFDSDVYVHGEKQEEPREKKPGQQRFVLLMFVNPQNDNTCGKKTAAHNVKWNQDLSLEIIDASRFELDGTVDTHHEKNKSKSNQRVSHHPNFLAGAST